MHALQNRWVLERRSLVYYGLRNRENLFRNRIGLTRSQADLIAALPKQLNDKDRKVLGKLLGEQVVAESEVRKTPASLGEAKFCKSCAANDFMIPGLEFDAEGNCPMCQTAKETEHLKSIVPFLIRNPAYRTLPFRRGAVLYGRERLDVCSSLPL